MQIRPVDYVECYWNRFSKVWHILKEAMSEKLLELPPTLFHGVTEAEPYGR